jgi:hypothetical protein
MNLAMVSPMHGTDDDAAPAPAAQLERRAGKAPP